MESSPIARVQRLARKHGVLRPRDLKAEGIPREYLRRMASRGLLERVGRGLYVLPRAPVTEHHTLVQVCKRLPSGVVCLLSALRFHEVTTQQPAQTWIAIDRKARRPAIRDLNVKVVRFSGPALTEGVEVHAIEGVRVKVYEVAKTVADCFKYRRKIGVDVAVEALQDAWFSRRVTTDALWKYARICRVANVMRPYLETLT